MGRLGRLLPVSVGSGSGTGSDGSGSDGAGDEVGDEDSDPRCAEPVAVGVGVADVGAPAARCADRDAAVGPPRPAEARASAARLDPPAAGAAVPAGCTSRTSGGAPAVLPPPASVVRRRDVGAQPVGQRARHRRQRRRRLRRPPQGRRPGSPGARAGGVDGVGPCSCWCLLGTSDGGSDHGNLGDSSRFAEFSVGRSRRAGRRLGRMDRVGGMLGVGRARGGGAGRLGRRAGRPRPGARVGPDGDGSGGGGRGPVRTAGPVAPAPRAARCRPGRARRRLDHHEVRGARRAARRRCGRVVSRLQAGRDEDADQRGSAGGRRNRKRGPQTPGSAMPGAAHVGPPGRSGRDGRPL